MLNGPHRLFFAPLLALLLYSCSSFVEEAPPPIGTVSGPDPIAAKLFAEAQAAEANGKTKKALKAYREISKAHAYSDTAPEAKFREAHLLDSTGDLLKAFEAYDEFIKRYPGSARYSQALQRQAVVAHAAADGHIKDRFLGLKSRVDRDRASKMLAEVRDNAPRSKEAPKAQYAIAQLWEVEKKEDRAIEAYETLLDEYPESHLTAEAQYRIGVILLAQSSRGNQNQANLDKADDAFHDLLLRYPNSKRAPDARAQISKIAGLDLQRSFDVGEFYYKKKQYTSASFYFREVVKQAPDGPLKNQANQRLAQINGMTS